MCESIRIEYSLEILLANQPWQRQQFRKFHIYVYICVHVYFIARIARRNTSIGREPLPTLDN